jgi:hypothetical protein
MEHIWRWDAPAGLLSNKKNGARPISNIMSD